MKHKMKLFKRLGMQEIMFMERNWNDSTKFAVYEIKSAAGENIGGIFYRNTDIMRCS